jgi:hypothetical protein
MKRLGIPAATLLIAFSSPSIGQASLDSVLVNALMEAAALPRAISQTATKCAQLVPDQASELLEASAYWKRANANEENFVNEILADVGKNDNAASSSIHAQANARTSIILAELNLNSANCNRWLLQVMTTRVWTHTARIPAQMKLIEQRFTKPS